MSTIVYPHQASRDNTPLALGDAAAYAYALSGHGGDPFGAAVYVVTPKGHTYELVFTADQLGTLLARARRFQREAKG